VTSGWKSDGVTGPRAARQVWRACRAARIRESGMSLMKRKSRLGESLAADVGLTPPYLFKRPISLIAHRPVRYHFDAARVSVAFAEFCGSNLAHSAPEPVAHAEVGFLLCDGNLGMDEAMRRQLGNPRNRPTSLRQRFSRIFGNSVKRPPFRPNFVQSQLGKRFDQNSDGDSHPRAGLIRPPCQFKELFRRGWWNAYDRRWLPTALSPIWFSSSASRRQKPYLFGRAQLRRKFGRGHVNAREFRNSTAR
jgi:hypothetical protein